MSSYAHISPERLVHITRKCINHLENYSGEEDTIKTYREFSFLKMRYLDKTIIDRPFYLQGRIGVVKRLKSLERIALAVIDDGVIVDRDIKLSTTTYNDLILLYKKDRRFQPYVFMGCY